MVKHKIRDFMIIMISVFTLVSCRGYVFIPIQGGTEDVRALRISADDAYDIKLGDQGAMNAETIEVLYSDGSTKMRSIASLAADKTIFEKSGITEDVLLKEGGAEAYTDIFVYDITLSEMQEKMTVMQEDISGMKGDISDLKKHVARLDAGYENLSKEMHHVSIMS